VDSFLLEVDHGFALGEVSLQNTAYDVLNADNKVDIGWLEMSKVRLGFLLCWLKIKLT
jgi:hypothetical protein